MKVKKQWCLPQISTNRLLMNQNKLCKLNTSEKYLKKTIFSTQTSIDIISYFSYVLLIGIQTADYYNMASFVTKYCDNIFVKRSIPTVCFADMAINPLLWDALLIQRILNNNLLWMCQLLTKILTVASVLPNSHMKIHITWRDGNPLLF